MPPNNQSDHDAQHSESTHKIEHALRTQVFGFKALAIGSVI